METQVNINTAYILSEDIVAREIEGEFIIVPLTSGIGDLEGELYSLNETGRAIWDKLDGKSSLKDVVKQLSESFEAPEKEIIEDVMGLAKELMARNIIVES